MFSKIAKWCDLLDLQFISGTTFFKYQRQYVIPLIARHCEASLLQARQEVIARGNYLLLAPT